MILARFLDKSIQGPLPSVLWSSSKALAGLLGLIGTILATGVIIQRYLDIDALRTSIATWGVLAPPMFILLLALRNLLFLPVLPLGVIIGFASLIFGTLYGALYFWLGTTAGSCVAFLVARYWVGDLALRFERGRLQKLDQMVSGHGFRAILGLRLVLFGNIWINYGGGLTSMSLRDFALGTLLGLTPRTFTLAYLFEGVQEPDLFAAMLSYPSLTVLSLLLGSMLVGVVLLASIARQERWRAQTALADSDR